MATLSHQEISDNIEKHLECVFCLEQFCEPKRLQCNHVFCKLCLHKLMEFMVDGSAYITCPLNCKQVTLITREQTVNDLNTDIYVQGILDNMYVKRVDCCKSITCEGGGCDNKITCYCYKCSHMLCNACASKHKSKHQGGYFTSIKYDERLNKVVAICDEHNMIADFICLEHECNSKFICLYCKERSHRNHYKETIDDKSVQIKRQLAFEEEKVEEMYENAQHIHKKLELEKENILDGRERLEEVVNNRILKSLIDFVGCALEEKSKLLNEYDFIVNNYESNYQLTDVHNFFQQMKNIEDLQVVLREKETLKSISKLASAKTNTPSLNIGLTDVTHSKPLGELKIRTGFSNLVASSSFSNTFEKSDVMSYDAGKLWKDLEQIVGKGDGLTSQEVPLDMASTSARVVEEHVVQKCAFSVGAVAYNSLAENVNFLSQEPLPNGNVGNLTNGNASNLTNGNAANLTNENAVISSAPPEEDESIVQEPSSSNVNEFTTGVLVEDCQNDPITQNCVTTVNVVSAHVPVSEGFNWNLPKKISLKSHHGKFVCVERSGRLVVADSLEIGACEQLKIEHLGGSVIAMKSYHNLYLGVTQSRNVVANRETIGPWEKFSIQYQGDGIIAFKTNEGKYLCAEKDGNVASDSQSIGKWEKFSIECFYEEGIELVQRSLSSMNTVSANAVVDEGLNLDLITKISLKSHYGKYVCVDPSGRLAADSLEVGSPEELNIEHLGKNMIAMKSNHDKYIGVTQRRNVVADRETIGAWEKFYVDDQGGGIIALKTNESKYLCAEKDGDMVAYSQRIGKCEKFMLQSL